MPFGAGVCPPPVVDRGNVLSDLAGEGMIHRSYSGTKEDKARCVASVFGNWHSSQCSRPRGHGEGGEYCKQHAAKGSPWQKPGDWEREQIDRATKIIERQEKVIAEATADRDQAVRIRDAMQAALAEEAV